MRALELNSGECVQGTPEAVEDWKTCMKVNFDCNFVDPDSEPEMSNVLLEKVSFLGTGFLIDENEKNKSKIMHQLRSLGDTIRRFALFRSKETIEDVGDDAFVKSISEIVDEMLVIGDAPIDARFFMRSGDKNAVKKIFKMYSQILTNYKTLKYVDQDTYQILEADIKECASMMLIGSDLYNKMREKVK